MAQTPRNHLAMQSLGGALTKLAIDKPASAKEIERWALVHHGFELSEDSIRKAHRGEVDPDKCNVKLLVALMAFYECEPIDLGVAAEKALRPLLSALGPAPEGGPGLQTGTTAWDGVVVPMFRHVESVPAPLPFPRSA